MLKLFGRYFSIGILNTAIHWMVFAVLVLFLDRSQAMANFTAFCVAVTFSFFANSKWTFKASATLSRYLIFVVFMGFIAVILGYIADTIKLPGLVTLVSFSIISLFLGFIYSHFIVFKE
ncbi:bactoprenol-linked glucose translocase (flippase) [Psychrobacter arcticus 273-4]|uniref:Bactoprenol-linked glucose translocase n=2 Tax=Psychrobacter arcticus TaxID=334543 RepID=Q4FU08_PSYA2|nr:bactoprenol-linked glucose translocase (flippase) [Psychrobacter arcticus 273-4]